MTNREPNYQLEQLGWLQFQQLCTLLLEAAGVPNTAWSGNADERRETYAETDLTLPASGLSLRGPVELRVAWVRTTPHRLGDSMSSPAPSAAAALDALRECIDQAICRPGPSLLVLTNLTPAQINRDPAAKVGLVGPAELSAELDARPELRRRLPATLGVRDLADLIGDDVRQASTFQISEAQQLARVFVATRSYRRALAALGRYAFVVLTGPPEMGKTAIARMVALAQLTAGWEAQECLRPDDVFRHYRRDRSQVFVADDAFGSTEYRADTAERWARELHRVLDRMDERHWLIWTSRPAPLRAGLRRVHRERGLERFPRPGDVQVDASELDRVEKALILFRHAKAAELREPAITFLRSHGPELVSHPYFTPERIRRYVATGLSSEAIPFEGADAEYFERRSAAYQHLREPTEAMAASFQALEPEHRDLLVAMLDVPGPSVSQRELVGALRRHHDGGLSRPPAEHFDRLADHFLRVSEVAVAWVHPSWRDLVIEQLAADPGWRRRFLSNCAVEGLAVAISTAGGATGGRWVPLLIHDADWDVLAERIWALLPELGNAEVARVIWALGEAVETAPTKHHRAEAEGLARTALELALRRFSHGPIPLEVLEAWYEMAAPINDAPAAPSLAATWAELLPSLPLRVETLADLARLDEWLRLADLLSRHDRDQLEAFGFPARYLPIIEELISAAETPRFDDDERAMLGGVLDRASSLFPGHAEALLSIGLKFGEPALALRGPEEIPTAELRDPDLSVARILRDL